MTIPLVWDDLPTSYVLLYNIVDDYRSPGVDHGGGGRAGRPSVRWMRSLGSWKDSIALRFSAS